MKTMAMGMVMAAAGLVAASVNAQPRPLPLGPDGSGSAAGIAIGAKPASELLEGCAGFVGEEANFEVQVDTERPSLRLRIESPPPSDAVLVVQLPDGSYRCNDDASPRDFQSQLDIENPALGTYRVWIGTFTNPSFTLSVSSPPRETPPPES
ncbi:hypothetical protein [Polyangium sorediatum]|uniref:Peptidase C-terminal archaeal/bacterial domain-containing protein n=1 Tax=Polyangium sorediatum TaxID=889274 RepID=A0ABT6NNB0_9BACT|nr:hypothetical protein [Polyangium sorediatum]MDI1429816.1 hypothetical protein [Polyangium sorediatum]